MGIRVVVAEDSVLLREGIAHLLATADDIEVIGSCGDLPSLLEVVEANVPDVVVTDIRMPPSGTDEGIVAATHFRQRDPTMGVVVLSQYANPAYALALLAHGAAGRAYLLKERVSEVNELIGAVREVAAGGSVIDSRVVETLVMATSRARSSDVERLTPREGQILAQMATGKSNSAIASRLVLSERAVEKHTNSIFSKLGLSEEREMNRRVRAVLMYLADQGDPDGAAPTPATDRASPSAARVAQEPPR
jgi:DNA-binding NarL/FixJ family response regulator